MARHETERDTYGGERRWSEGAGVSWAVDKTGPEHSDQPHYGDSEPVLWRGSEASASTSGGILRQLSDELGITRPDAAELRSDEQIREDVSSERPAEGATPRGRGSAPRNDAGR